MKRSTIKDVAALAGVSAATVSRVFSNEPSVSLEIASKVKNAAKRLNYRPNMMARSLTSSQTNLVALVVGSLHNQFDAQLVEVLSKGLQKSGRRLLLVPADHGENDPAAMVALDYQVDGVIVAAGHLSKESAERFAQLGVPVILYGRTLDEPGVDCVVADNHSASRAIGQLFQKAGSKQAMFVRHVRRTFSDDEREAGYRDGLGPDIEMTVFECTELTARELSLGMLSEERRPDAIFCANDVLAFGVIEAAIQLGLNVPNELMVAGFDDVCMASSPFFDLTTLHQSPFEIASWIVKRLDERLSSLDVEVTTERIPARLKLRGSTPAAAHIGGVAASKCIRKAN